MKKTKILLVVTALLLSSFIFSGCTQNILYNTWQLQETIDAETKESSQPMFANIMVFEIKKDGTVVFMDKVFGTYEKSRNEFTFTYAEDEENPEDTPEQVSGGWEIIKNDLYIYPDTDPVIYKFAAVVTDDTAE